MKYVAPILVLFSFKLTADPYAAWPLSTSWYTQTFQPICMLIPSIKHSQNLSLSSVFSIHHLCINDDLDQENKTCIVIINCPCNKTMKNIKLHLMFPLTHPLFVSHSYQYCKTCLFFACLYFANFVTLATSQKNGRKYLKSSAIFCLLLSPASKNAKIRGAQNNVIDRTTKN